VRQALEAVGLLSDRPDVFLKDDLWRWGGTDHFGEPPPMGWAPGGPACIPDILPEQEGVEPECGGLQVPPGIFAGTAQIPNGFIFDRGDIDGGKIPRAHQPSQLHRITTVGFDAVARFLGKESGGHDPTVVALLPQVPVEPIAAWSRFLDQYQVVGF
jgi:hypothetical protein